uniref:hypothetical protein n=1 Tax=unclassified Sphingomonas TaxID=196159 RepID=UPI003CF5D05D
IRREHASGKAIKAIARDLHLSRKVVRKAIRAPEADMGYRRYLEFDELCVIGASQPTKEGTIMVAKYLMAVAAAALAVAPAAAAPSNPAASLSVAKSVRTGSASAKKSELAGGGLIVALVAAAAVVAGIVIVADSGDSN